MAFGVVHHFPGGTKENYEASIAAVHPGPGQLPDGQVFHAAGVSPGGWTIVAVHESKESWERFRDGILLPKLQAGVPGGFPTPPQETEIDLVTVLP
ncbi:MAG: hypothetical protein M3R48_04060 [Candidatus Dormibacteraeota bacterium]|nr:hypothetical protein [Candidatus Dormibacteraeota bacterium]